MTFVDSPRKPAQPYLVRTFPALLLFCNAPDCAHYNIKVLPQMNRSCCQRTLPGSTRPVVTWWIINARRNSTRTRCLYLPQTMVGGQTRIRSASVRSKKEPVEAGIRTPIFVVHKNKIATYRDMRDLASNIDIGIDDIENIAASSRIR